MSKGNRFVVRSCLVAVAASVCVIGWVGNLAAADYEAEAWTISAASPAAAATSGQSGSSNNAFVCFNTTPTAAGTYYVELTTPSLSAGTYSLSYLHKANTNRGRFQVSVDGVNVGGLGDQYATTPTNMVNISVGTVTLTAGTHRIRWTTNSKNAGSAGYMVTIDRITLTPTGATNYTLTTTASNGTVTLTPAGGSYAAGTTVTLLATPATGYRFSSWGGSASGTTNPLSVVVNSNLAITAAFTAAPVYTFSTAVSPSGSGTITLSPAGGSYAAGTVVTVMATAASGYQFSGWSGGISGSTNPATVTVNNNMSVTAGFALITPPSTSSAVAYGEITSAVNVTSNNTTVLQLTINAPASGFITVNATGLYGTQSVYTHEQRGLESFITLNSTSGGSISEYAELMPMEKSAQYVHETAGFAVAQGSNTVRLVVSPRTSLSSTVYKFVKCKMTVVFSTVRM